MNKLFTKIATAFVGIAMAVGVGVAVGNNTNFVKAEAASRVITFNAGSGDGSSVSTSTACSTIVSAGSSYLSGNVAAASNAYHGGSNGLKLGKSSGAGSLKMNLASTTTTNNIVVVSAKKYNSSKAATINVSSNITASNSAQNLTSDFADYDFSFGSGSTYIQLNSSNYCWVESVTFLDIYTISFSSNGGSNNPESQQIPSGRTFTFPSAGTKTGYSFLGWSSDSGTTKYAAGDTSPAISANTTYTAYWEEIVNPQVTLDKNVLNLTRYGEIDSGTVEASILNITNPTYSWTKQSGDDCVILDNANTNEVTVTSKGTALSASAVVRLTVTGRNKDNTADITPITKDVTVNVSKVSSVEHPFTIVEANSIISSLESGNSDNLYLTGTISQVDSISSGKITYWISADGTTTDQFKIYQGKDIGNENFSAKTDLYVGDQVVVYGNLSKQYGNMNTGNYLASITKLQYSVSFDGNSGKGEMETVSENRGTYLLPANGFTAPSSKYFAGWKVRIGEELDNTLRAAGSSYTLVSNITLVAQWNDLVTLTYNGNAASGSMAAEEYGSGAPVTVKGNGYTVPSGKIFNGWNTEANGTGVAYTVGQVFNITANITLYAQWAAKVTVTYNANGGSNAPASQDYASGATATAASGSGMTAPNSSLAFAKWNTKADGTGTDRAAGAEFTISENMTLYAIWQKLPLTIGTNGCSDSSEQTEINWGTVGTSGNKVSNIYYNGVHYEVTGTGDNGKVYSGPSWRFYYSGGSTSALTVSLISSDAALRIKSVKVTFTLDKNGTLKYGDAVLTSGTALDLTSYNLNSVVLKVGNTDSGTKGTVIITSIDTVVGYVSSFEAAQTFESSFVKRNIAYPEETPTGVDGTACLSTEEGGLGYYDTAITEYGKLSEEAKVWFASRAEFANARERLQAWARANKKTLTFNSTTGVISVSGANAVMFNLPAEGSSVATFIAIVAVVSTLSVGGFFFIRKKKNVK